MSLRLRMTLLYTSLLSIVVLTLSFVMYAMIHISLVNQIDNFLEHSADHVMGAIWVGPDGEVGIESEELEIYFLAEFQVWSNEGEVLFSSGAEDIFREAWDIATGNNGDLNYETRTINNTPYRFLSLPLEADGEDYGWLQIAMPLTEMQRTRNIVQIVFTTMTIFVIIASSFLGWFVVGKGLQPLVTMADIAKNISITNDLSQRLPVETGHVDEIGQLSLTFNHTLARLERLFKTQRRFLADVSHELRTPLTVIKGNVGLMGMTHEFDQESLDSIENEVDRLTRMVGDLLLMAQAESGRLPLMMAPVEIDDLLFEVFEQMKVLSGGAHDIRIVEIEPAIIAGDRDRLKQVFLNLGVNAIKYTPSRKKITLGLNVRDEWVKVTVSDEGQGIPKAEVGVLFQRFYRGDKSRKRDGKDGGFGLGLPIAYWIVCSHGGRIDVETEIDSGTTFTVWLPISQTDVPTRPLDEEEDK